MMYKESNKTNIAAVNIPMAAEITVGRPKVTAPAFQAMDRSAIATVDPNKPTGRYCTESHFVVITIRYFDAVAPGRNCPLPRPFRRLYNQPMPGCPVAYSAGHPNAPAFFFVDPPSVGWPIVWG